jgi:hypothetical protein
MEIRVVPGTLSAAGGEITALGGDVRGVGGSLRAAMSSASGSCGFPEPEGALETCLGRWAPALAQSAEAIAAMGGALGSAAALYTFTDATAIP